MDVTGGKNLSAFKIVAIHETPFCRLLATIISFIYPLVVSLLNPNTNI